jgi:hypothetical protein
LANKEYEDYNNTDLVVDAHDDSSESLPSNVDPADKDQVHDFHVQKYLRDLQKVGIHSKQILNYSYPPLLYQRGDDSDENGGDGEDEGSQEESPEEELSHAQFGEDLDVGDLLGRELGLDESEENADLRQQNAEAADEEIEQMVDGFFSKNDPAGLGHEDSGDGMIDGVDVSEIQRMINKSGGSDGSPGLDRFNREMNALNGLDGNQIDFYNQHHGGENEMMLQDGVDFDADELEGLSPEDAAQLQRMGQGQGLLDFDMDQFDQ